MVFILALMIKYTFFDFVLVKYYFLRSVIDKVLLNNIFYNGILAFLIKFVRISPELITDLN